MEAESLQISDGSIGVNRSTKEEALSQASREFGNNRTLYGRLSRCVKGDTLWGRSALTSFAYCNLYGVLSKFHKELSSQQGLSDKMSNIPRTLAFVIKLSIQMIGRP